MIKPLLSASSALNISFSPAISSSERLSAMTCKAQIEIKKIQSLTLITQNVDLLTEMSLHIKTFMSFKNQHT